MGRINSRAKGAAAEREIANILKDHLGIDARRNLEQTRSGGYDILGLDGWAIEVKRTKSYSEKYWEQAVTQAIDATKSQGEFEWINPVLLYRLDRQKWKAEILGRDVIPELSENHELRVTMPIEAWIEIVRERM